MNLTPAPFRDRSEAGRALARLLERRYDGGRGRRGVHEGDLIVLALPRGGVPVAYEVAAALHAPLDVFLVRKLGVPGRPELAMGAIASGGTRVLDEGIVSALHVPDEAIERVTQQEQRELERRARAFRGDRPEPDVEGRTVIVVDDGLATGSTMRAAVAALRERGPDRIVVAVPVGSASTCTALASEADDVVCAEMPEPFYAVGQGYDEFDPTTDEEVLECLRRAREDRAAEARPS